ncbi:MAG TPA: enoyl-CoA hydratase [Acetobacteraceae bacterium]|nr:enoyl-CoA hydratase [Acetobacteraceae bacterium]
MEYAGGKMLAEVSEGVGVVTFNQPEKRNAMSVEMWQGLEVILERFAADSSVRAVVLTGAGDKAFVSGADISQFEKNRANADAQMEYDRLTSAGRRKLGAFPKPVIVRIRGFCLGGGLGIAMQADLRIASADSQFGIPAARLGIAYGFEMVRALVSLVGPAHARMILYTGGRIDAAEALRIGLVNRVVAPEMLEREVSALARQIAENAPLSLAASKLAVAASLQDPADRDLERLRRASQACFDSADYREGRTAFMEKRRPQFIGQ